MNKGINVLLRTVLSEIEERLEHPTARGLATAIGQAVGDGVITAGDRLPPIRTVATQLGMSPTTVAAAWAMLARAGTIETRGRGGTVVVDRRVGPIRYRRSFDRSAPFALDLSSGTPDPKLLPDLAPALRRAAAYVPTTYLDDPLVPALGQLLRSDWPFTPGQLTVVDGAMDAMQLITATHLRFGDRIAVEQPTFPPLLDVLDSAGTVPVPVEIDDDGPQPERLRAAVGMGVRAFFFQPRAHNPTGASLTAARARRLAQILGRNAPIVIEDDSAGAISSSPLVSLGDWLPDRTLHIRSFSKSYGPDLRLAAVGGPAVLVDPIIERRFLGQGWTSRLLQGLLVDLLTHPQSVRAVERARLTYAERRSSIVAALSEHGIPVAGRDGLNIWVPVQDESAALLRLAADGIGAAAGAPFSTGGQPPHLRLTAGLIRTGQPELARCIASAARTGRPLLR